MCYDDYKKCRKLVYSRVIWGSVVKKNHYFVLGFSLLVIIGMIFGISSSIKHETIEAPKVMISNKVYKIGVYNMSPFYQINESGEVTGFYDEVLRLIKQDINFEHDYVMGTISQHLMSLEKGEIDFILGIQPTDELEEKFTFTHTSLSDGKYGLLHNGDIEGVTPLKVALVNGEPNNKLALRYLKAEGINYIEIETENLTESWDLLENDRVDVILTPLSKETSLENIVYQFSTGPTYIVGNQEMSQFIKLLDSYTENSNNFNSQLDELKRIYLSEEYSPGSITNLISFLLGTILLITTFLSLPKLNRYISRQRISRRLNNQEYLIYYQPIIDPRSGQVNGLEALLRLEHATQGILSPYYFMDEIITSGALCEVSLWILKKVILDYQIIKRYQMHNPIFNSKFYVSINITARELEDKYFVNELKKYVCEATVPAHAICLELAEGTKIQHMERVRESIECLKEIGIKFAIDDFGVDYSNLNVLDKIKYDFIKIDKNFIDNVETSDVNRAIIEFIANFTDQREISIVFEGVETQEQVEFIKKTVNDNSYIQGYYYARPLSLELIKFYGN